MIYSLSWINNSFSLLLLKEVINELERNNTIRSLLIIFPFRISTIHLPLHPLPFHSLLFRDDTSGEHTSPNISQNEPWKPVLSINTTSNEYIRQQSIRRIDHHFSQIVGTPNILKHAICNQSLLVLKCIILLSIGHHHYRNTQSMNQNSNTHHRDWGCCSTSRCNKKRSNPIGKENENDYRNRTQKYPHAATLDPIVQGLSKAKSGIT